MLYPLPNKLFKNIPYLVNVLLRESNSSRVNGKQIFCSNKTHGKIQTNLIKVRPLFTLSHRGSDDSSFLIVFCANYIEQSNLIWKL